MKRSHSLAVLLCVGVLASAAMAQPVGVLTTTKTTVMDMIPAGALGYVVIPNIKDATERVDKFLNDIGVGGVPGGLLPMIKGQAMLGDGFDATGGLAIVVLDPMQTGYDVSTLINTGEPGEPESWPVVVLVPGKGVTEVLGQLVVKTDDDFFALKLPTPFTIKVAHKNGYLIVSPSTKAIKAVMSNTRSAAAHSPADHMQLIARSNVSMHMNMTVGGPIMTALIKALEDKMKDNAAGRPAFAMQMAMLPMQREMIQQVDAISFAARLTPSDAVLEQMVTFTPGSKLATASAVTTNLKPTLDKLPDLPHVFAFSGVANRNKKALAASEEFNQGMMNALTKMLPKDLLDQMNSIQKKLAGQVTKAQFVVGGAPEGSGLFGLAVVMECRKSSAVTSVMNDAANLMTETIKHFGADNDDLADLRVSYNNGVEQAGNVSVDAISVTHPKMAEMDDDDKEGMKKVLGEDKIRVLIAAPDEKTVVVTFGGSVAFLNEAIKAAKGGGNLLTGAQNSRIAGYAPEKTVTLVVFNASNLLDVVKKAMAAMGAPPQALPITVEAKEPVVIVGGVTGQATHAVTAVPTALIKDIATAVKQKMGGGRGAGMPPADDDDF